MQQFALLSLLTVQARACLLRVKFHWVHGRLLPGKLVQECSLKDLIQAFL